MLHSTVRPPMVGVEPPILYANPTRTFNESRKDSVLAVSDTRGTC